MWLPITIGNASTSGAYITPESLRMEAENFYVEDSKPYTLNIYDQSFSDKIAEQYGPGNAWHNKSTKSTYRSNQDIEAGIYDKNLVCSMFNVSGKGLNIRLINTDSYHIEGGLHVVKTEDEDGSISYEFSNPLTGQIILTRQMDGRIAHDTYYVYDDFGNLCYVLPPILSDKIIKENKLTTDDGLEMMQYAYIYKYDERNRCVKKKLPGCDWVYYRYDEADQLMFSQDGEQRKKSTHESGYELGGIWTFNAYDKLGKIVLNGECENVTNPTNRGVSKAYYEQSYADWQNMGYRFENIEVWYNQIFSVNYYDNYDF